MYHGDRMLLILLQQSQNKDLNKRHSAPCSSMSAILTISLHFPQIYCYRWYVSRRLRGCCSWRQDKVMRIRQRDGPSCRCIFFLPFIICIRDCSLHDHRKKHGDEATHPVWWMSETRIRLGEVHWINEQINEVRKKRTGQLDAAERRHVLPSK